MALYGRTDLLDQLALASNRGAVVLLTGDSGVGKSSVLDAAQDNDRRRGVIAPVPTRLTHAGGALQRGLLDQLASAAAAVITDAGIAERVLEALAIGARQIAEDKGQELALVIGKELLQVARGRLGADVGEAFAQYVRSLTSSGEHTLRARIQAVDSDVLATVISLYQEVIQVAGKDVGLALDNAERMGQEDIRQLADLTERLPIGAAVRVAYTLVGPDHSNLPMLTSAGVLQIDVQPLDDTAVAEWLQDVGLDVELAPSVQRVADGYALYVDEAISILRRGESLRDVTIGEFFERSTKDTLRSLDIDVSMAAQRLAVYIDAPPFDRVAELLDVDGMRWTEVRTRLLESRIFISQAGGDPWFHELRRRVVWGQLDETIRGPAADAAVAELTERFEATSEPELLIALAEIATESPEVISQPSQKAVLEASIDEIAIAAAVIELSEPGGPPGQDALFHVTGDSLLVYARDVFRGADSDFLSALSRLQERGLLNIISNQSVSVVFPTIDVHTFRLIVGRAGAELRRIPIPRLATAAFNAAIRPKIGVFSTARYGLGQPAVGGLAREAWTAAVRAQTTPAWSAYHLPPHAIVFADALGEPLYASITFKNLAARNEAVEGLRGAREPLLGSEVLVNDVLELPVTRIPAEILLQAAGLILDERLQTIRPSIKAPRPLNAREVAVGRADTVRYMRALCNRVERYALDLDQPVQLAYAGDDHRIELIEIHGGQDGVRELTDSVTVPWADPYLRFKLRRDLHLTRHERLGTISDRITAVGHEKEPIIEALTMLRERAANFNEKQERLAVPLEERSLKSLLQQSMNRRFDIATAMYQALPFTVSTHPPSPARFLVLVCPDMPQLGMVDGSSAIVSVCSFDPDPGQEISGDTVEVAVTPAVANPGYGEVEAGFLDRFGIDVSFQDYLTSVPGLRHKSHGDAKHVLARLLGYRIDDIALRYATTDREANN